MAVIFEKWRPPNPFCYDRIHHFYIGGIIAFFGWYTNDGLMTFIGLLFMLDDVIEHTITEDTPLRIFYEKFMLPYMPVSSACDCAVA